MINVRRPSARREEKGIPKEVKASSRRKQRLRCYDKAKLTCLFQQKSLKYFCPNICRTACVPSPVGAWSHFHTHLPVPAAERIPGEDAVVAGGVPPTGRHGELHESGGGADVDAPLDRETIVNAAAVGLLVHVRKAGSSPYQRRGNEQSLNRLGLLKHLELFDDVDFSVDVHGPMQPAIVWGATIAFKCQRFCSEP